MLRGAGAAPDSLLREFSSTASLIVGLQTASGFTTS
jgi:hypothetical protein